MRHLSDRLSHTSYTGTGITFRVHRLEEISDLYWSNNFSTMFHVMFTKVLVLWNVSRNVCVLVQTWTGTGFNRAPKLVEREGRKPLHLLSIQNGLSSILKAKGPRNFCFLKKPWTSDFEKFAGQDGERRKGPQSRGGADCDRGSAMRTT